jgi:hypothetical protein
MGASRQEQDMTRCKQARPESCDINLCSFLASDVCVCGCACGHACMRLVQVRVGVGVT